jgi:hypothetical protein
MRHNQFSLVLIKRCFAALLVLNSTLNSVIFFWRNKALRDEGKRLIKTMRRPQNVTQPVAPGNSALRNNLETEL